MARAKVVEDWTRDGGVLLMGYEMYRLLSLKKSFVTGRKRKTKKPAGPVIIDLDEEDRQQELMKGLLGIAGGKCIAFTLVMVYNEFPCVLCCLQGLREHWRGPGRMLSYVTRATVSKTATPAPHRP